MSAVTNSQDNWPIEVTRNAIRVEGWSPEQSGREENLQPGVSLLDEQKFPMHWKRSRKRIGF